MIKHNAKWIEQNLKVKCVQTIALRRSLKGYNLSHREFRSAVVHSDKPILYIISKGYDILEISQALVPVLLQRSKPQYIFMLEMIARLYNAKRLGRNHTPKPSKMTDTTQFQGFFPIRLTVQAGLVLLTTSLS